MKKNFSAREKILNIAANWAILLVTLIICWLVLEYCLSKYNACHYFTFDDVNPNFNRHIKDNLWIADSELGYVPGPAWIASDGCCGCQNGKKYLNMAGQGKDILLIGDSLLQYRYLEKAFEFFLKEPYRIWNAGIGGYNTLQEALYLETRIKMTPEIIIVGFCENDFTPCMTIVPRDKKMAYNLFGPAGEYNPALFRYSAVYRYFKIKKAQFGIKKYSSVEGVIANSSIVKQGFSKIKEYAAKNGALLFCILYPHLDEAVYDRGWQKKSAGNCHCHSGRIRY
ncbi:MAG: hypothetical protein V1662_03355 [Candidatus Omnitrophota bacterium]